MIRYAIRPVNIEIADSLQQKIDQKTKPLGALGKLEVLAKKIGSIQNTLTPSLNNPVIVIFAGDHGLAKEGVSPYPQEVTWQMVYNFLQGGAGINVFAKQNGLKIKVVDAGVNYDFEPHPDLINSKIGKGTCSCLQEPAMTESQCLEAMFKGGTVVEALSAEGTNIIGFGEMGIGNTSSASLIMSLLCKEPIEKCIGRGTGLSDEGLDRKKKILAEVLQKQNHKEHSVESALRTFGGFEIVMMCGAMLKAAELGMVLIIDGFIASAALLAASKIDPLVLEYCIFAHKSDEQGHKCMLQHLNAEPLLDLGMRLGEGTGAAVAYPLIQASVNFLNEMASFESAGVSEKD